MSDGGEHAVDAGVGERGTQPVEQVGAAVHRRRTVADGERAAGGVVGGDDHQPAVAADGGAGGAAVPGPGDRAGIGGAQVGDCGVVGASGASERRGNFCARH